MRNIKDDNDVTECNSGSYQLKEAEELNNEQENDVKNGAVNRRLLDEEQQSDKKNVENTQGAKNEKKSVWRTISEQMDLALLKDIRYVAVILGMGVSLVAETNFNMMIPFVLTELSGLERTSIATVMSIQAVSDITGRLCVPLLAQKVGWTSRNLYVLSLIGSTLGRTSTYSNVTLNSKTRNRSVHGNEFKIRWYCQHGEIPTLW